MTDGAAPMLVAIDGPAGSGKSSVSREAAERLSFGILDTGAAYRALAWAAQRAEVDLDDAAAVGELAAHWRYRATLRGAPDISVQLVEGDEAHSVTRSIRDPEISAQVSRVSQHSGVREQLNRMFRQIVAESGLAGVVIEGRDITTVVAPNAPVRILLTASPEVRAARRAGELPGVPAEQVLKGLIARDAKDALVVDFFHPAPGVTLIDTSNLNFAQSVDAVIDTVEAKRASGQADAAAAPAASTTDAPKPVNGE